MHGWMPFHSQHVPHGRPSTLKPGMEEDWGGGAGTKGGWWCVRKQAGSDRGHGVDIDWLCTLNAQTAF